MLALSAALIFASFPAGAERNEQPRTVQPPAATGSTPSPPTDENEFTSYVAEMLEQALPELQISVAGPLTIMVRTRAGGSLQANLDRFYMICDQHPADCEPALADYVAAVAETAAELEAQPDEAQLRAAVRETGFVEGQLTAVASRNGDRPVAEPLTGGLSLVLYFDFPQTLRAVQTADLQRLGLSPTEATVIAIRNVAAALRPLRDVVQDLPSGSLGIIEGDPYESSRLILHDDWAWLAEQMDGQLIVAVPTQNIVLYGEDNGPDAVPAMAALAEKAGLESGWALSPTVFRWTPTGWEPISP